MPSKDLPAIDFRAALARRDPDLAKRLDETATSVPLQPSVLAPAPASALPTSTPGRRRRGIVARANTEGGAGRITLYVPPELALRLRAYCFAQDRTISDVAGTMLVEALERLPGC
jgi:hypothetical protein